MNEKTKTFFNNLRHKIGEIIGLSEDTDANSTIEGIKKSVEFRGANVWVLAFAIIIASVGLNVNSTAVIIGAMLISPLMGPIMGIGLAVGISDSDLLNKSLKNFIIMVIISLLASTSYFLISPLSDAQSELLARTSPTIYDVLIAFFGGMAGIVASSRKEKSTSVIAGVAIATALMPPLCTAGYGLSTGQWNYFGGAFYLFFINSFFIALATFLLVRYLHFPMTKYLDVKKQRMVRRGITIFAIVVLIPSVWMGIQVVKETSFNSSVIKYVDAIQKNDFWNDVELLKYNKEYSHKEKKIYLSIVGKKLTENQIGILNEELAAYGLTNTKLIVKQTGGLLDEEAESNLVIRLLQEKEEQLRERDSVILELRQAHGSVMEDEALLAQVAQELRVQYPDVEEFAVARMVATDSVGGEHYQLVLKWREAPNSDEEAQIRRWLSVRLGIEL